jgi:hypothetical protein
MKNKWKVWKTIKIGTHGNNEAFRYVLKAAHIKIVAGAELTLEKIQPAKFVKEVKLINITRHDLNLPEQASYNEICKTALSNGLALCPAEVGPHLCWQYGKLPILKPHEVRCERIIMKPIFDKIGNERYRFIFEVMHTKYGIQLGVDHYSPMNITHSTSNSRLIFMLKA